MADSETLFSFFLASSNDASTPSKSKAFSYDPFSVEKIATEVLFRSSELKSNTTAHEDRHALLLTRLLSNHYLTYLWSHWHAIEVQKQDDAHVLFHSTVLLFSIGLDMNHPCMISFLAELELEDQVLVSFLTRLFESSLGAVDAGSHAGPLPHSCLSLTLIQSLYRRFSFLKPHAPTLASFLLKMVSVVVLKNGLSFHEPKMAFYLSTLGVESKLYSKCASLVDKGNPIWLLASRWLPELIESLFTDDAESRFKQGSLHWAMLTLSAFSVASRTGYILTLFSIWLSQKSLRAYPAILFQEHHILVRVDAQLGLELDSACASELRLLRDQLLLLLEDASLGARFSSTAAFQKACYRLYQPKLASEPHDTQALVLKELALAPPWLLHGPQCKALLARLSPETLLALFDAQDLLYRTSSHGLPLPSDLLVSILYARLVDDHADASPSHHLLPTSISDLFSHSEHILTVPFDDYLDTIDYQKKSYHAFLFQLAEQVKLDILESLSELGPTLSSSASETEQSSPWLWSRAERHGRRRGSGGVVVDAMPVLTTTPAPMSIVENEPSSLLIVTEQQKLNVGLTKAHAFLSGWRKQDELFLVRLASPFDRRDAQDSVRIAHVLPCYFISHLSNSPHSIIQVQVAPHERDLVSDPKGASEPYHLLVRRKGVATRLMAKMFDLLKKAPVDREVDAKHGSDHHWVHDLVLGRGESRERASQHLEQLKPGLAVLVGHEERLISVSNELLRQFYLANECSLVLAKTEEALEKLEQQLDLFRCYDAETNVESGPAWNVTARHRRYFVGRVANFSHKFSRLIRESLTRVEQLAASLGDVIQSDALDCAVSEHYYDSKVKPLLDAFFARLHAIEASRPDSVSEGELLMTEFPLAAYFGSRCESLLDAETKSWAERASLASRLRAEIDALFLDLAALRPLELLTTKQHAQDYLKRRCSIVMMTGEQFLLSYEDQPSVHFDNVVILESQSLAEAETLLPVLYGTKTTSRLVLTTTAAVKENGPWHSSSMPWSSMLPTRRSLLQRVLDRNPSASIITL